MIYNLSILVYPIVVVLIIVSCFDFYLEMMLADFISAEHLDAPKIHGKLLNEALTVDVNEIP